MTRLGWLFTITLFTSLCGCEFGDNAARRPPSHHMCSDGIVDFDEGCDDGNAMNGDGCSAACEVESPNAACGNGVREVGEACDDGNQTAGDGCSASCGLESICGNGTLEAGEACDDDNLTSGDGCSPTCQIETAAACGVIPQTGCPTTAPACDVATTGPEDTACRVVTGNGTSDDLCATPTSCGIGFSCIDEGAGTANDASCRKFCQVDGDCGTNAKCAYSLNDENDIPLGLKVCSNACSILHQTGCPSGWGCLGADAAGGDFTECTVMGTTPDGGSCTEATQCMRGSTCVNIGGGTEVCLEYCNVNNPNCDAGETCTGFVSPLMISGTTYGACN
ncbi:MAG: Metal dependent amidohydrolase [Myxococcales bacterium]|nr:Metal dependent amidohydrolase [Myxococcales bacterium]